MKSQGFLLAYVVIGFALIFLLFNFQARVLKAREDINEISKLYSKIVSNVIDESFFILRLFNLPTEFLNLSKIEHDILSLTFILNYTKNA
ncbi:MAG: hypothetical protein RMJ17_00450, partial [Candidatus Aenigmarchaeota archaeon]|nr:hypothetical protein [Candidatus Aenigmarchaeota archaeon]MDW8149059.1 hypothetical protein [Candidatus Aenigmarchaeota archaeon]